MSTAQVYMVCSWPPPSAWMQAPRTLDSLRRSIDGSKCMLVWDAGTQPAGVAVLDHAAILAVMATPEWTTPDMP